MYTVEDYLSFRGDLNFRDYPVNEIDEMIFASLGKADYSGILGEKETRKYTEVFNEFFYAHGRNEDERLGLLAPQALVRVLHETALCPRYSDIEISHYMRDVSEEETKQISALTVLGPGGTVYVTYRGTDDTLIGWKENCELAVQESVPAQREAVSYLKKVADDFRDRPIVVLGHSKGGNLGVYASAHAGPEVQSRIVKTVSYDGPGFNSTFLETTGFLAVKDRVTTVVPKTSIVGMLMEYAGKMSVVSCGKNGAAAHDFFNWNLTKEGFVTEDGLSEKSLVFRQAVNAILDGMDAVERQELVEELFEALTSTGASNLMDFTEHTFARALTVADRFRKSKEIRQFIVLLSDLCLRGTVNTAMLRIQDTVTDRIHEIKDKIEEIR